MTCLGIDQALPVQLAQTANGRLQNGTGHVRDRIISDRVRKRRYRQRPFRRGTDTTETEVFRSIGAEGKYVGTPCGNEYAPPLY